MRTSLLVCIYFLIISCNLEPTETVPDKEEVIVASIEGVKAYIDAKMIDQNFTLFLELDESFKDINHLLPIETNKICDLLAEEFYSFSFDDQAGCASSLFGRYGLRIHRGNERVQLIISGDILTEYDSLNTLLSINDTISYQINKNTMRLNNPNKGLEALFVAEARD